MNSDTPEMSSSYGDLFSEPDNQEELVLDEPQETVPEGEETDEESSDGADSSEESEESEESEGSEESELPSEPEDDKPVVVAKIDIDGKEFEFDEPKIQKLAEQYIEVATQNQEMVKHREVVQEAMNHIESIRQGVDIDEAMMALGVDFDKLITDRVKDFIRRSTMSQKERENEDIRKENEKLRRDREEHEARQASAREQEEGRRHAEEIYNNVKFAVSKIPEKFQQEVQIELMTQIEKKIRSGGVRPSARAIANATQIIYERKQKILAPEPKKIKQPPKPLKNSATPPTNGTKKGYNAVDYNEIFKRG